MLGTGFPESPGKPTIAWKGPASASLLEKRNERALLVASGCAHAARPHQARRGVARSACWGSSCTPHRHSRRGFLWFFFLYSPPYFFLQNKRNIHFYLGHYYKQREKENGGQPSGDPYAGFRIEEIITVFYVFFLSNKTTLTLGRHVYTACSHPHTLACVYVSTV